MGRQRFRDGARNPAAQTVAYALTHTLRLDHTLAPQDCQMLRHERLLQIKVGCEAANRLISLNQPAHDHETVRARQRLQEIAGV